jgi:Protein of unknown function (DUF1236)
LLSGETIMTKGIVSFGAIVAILALPLAVHAQPTRGTAGAGAATGTATRTVAGAPGAGGAVLSADQSAKVHEYVMKENRPSVKVTQKVAVGTALPTSVELYPLPADLGLKSDYRYGVVNEHTVLVEAKTHKITQIIN